MSGASNLRRFPGVRATAWAFFAYLYIPIVVLLVLAFNAGSSATIWEGFSTRWFGVVLGNPDILRAAQNSLIVALVFFVLTTIGLGVFSYVLFSDQEAKDAAVVKEQNDTKTARALAKENELLLPGLDSAGVDLGAALAGMHEILGGMGEPDELDVRTLPRGGRHDIIVARLDQLLPGGRFVILNDHDPEPLRYQTDALWPGELTWAYLETGPLRWKVEITRAD